MLNLRLFYIFSLFCLILIELCFSFSICIFLLINHNLTELLSTLARQHSLKEEWPNQTTSIFKFCDFSTCNLPLPFRLSFVLLCFHSLFCRSGGWKESKMLVKLLCTCLNYLPTWHFSDQAKPLRIVRSIYSIFKQRLPLAGMSQRFCFPNYSSTQIAQHQLKRKCYRQGK